MALWDKVLSFFAGEAAGAAAGDVVKPAFEPTRQNAWARRPYAVLEPRDAAEVATKGIPSEVDLEDDALRGGIGVHRFNLLREAARRYPGTAEALLLWRRGIIDQPDFTKALRRAGVPDEWVGHLSQLKQEHLSPEVVALGIVRGLIKDPGILPVGPPTREGKVPAFPTFDVDALEEAAGHGTSKTRLSVLVGEMGRPMGPEAAASAVFRDIIERVDFDRAVAEGDVRNEWADAIFEQARQILSSADYVQAHLRGWITEAEMYEGTARHGMSKADTKLMYLRAGRPAAPGQMATAAVRGIDGPDGRPMDKAQFLKGIRQSDIRPEWGEMLWDARFLYPPLFQLTRLVQAGAIDADTARDWAVKDRYPPEVVTALHKYWSQDTAAKPDSHVGKAQTQLWTATHSAYLAGDATDAVVDTKLQQIGVTADARPKVLALWKHEREVIRQRLTATQVKKAYKKPVTNPATGAPWSYDDALAELLSRGWSAQDAQTFLAE